MAGLTRALGEFVASLGSHGLPPGASEVVKHGAIDCVGVLLAGVDEPATNLIRDFVRPREQGEARVLFGNRFAGAADAALVNATAAHALDYDDTGLDGHPSVILVPTILAEGERIDAGGAEAIAAYVAGYEVWGELVSREEDKLHGKGWHPTAVYGTIAAAAAAASLSRLDAACTASALGIAASMASGVISNFGSMTKPFQAGRAAQNGILATRLAAAGLTAAPDALEHRNGFLRAVSPAGRVRLDGAISAGVDWKITRAGLNVKRYPVCYALHRAADSLLALRKDTPFDAASIEEIEVRIGRLQANMLRHSRPRNALDAKFSAEFAMASCVVAGRLGLAELRDDFVRSERVQALLPRVRVTTSDESDPEEPLFAPSDRVRVRLRDGRVLEGAEVRHARGHARNPVGEEELQAKFADCVGDRLPADRRSALLRRLQTLEKSAIRELHVA